MIRDYLMQRVEDDAAVRSRPDRWLGRKPVVVQ